ncbi:hypothetical protein PYW08_010466 [Mythimna loreyi]|uniref:Uncharacterized protein n=1 Tax=Mythimna loreyi TaxID=667449 RepID=A0ACC2Q9Q5_9NEOP|nr:hypothetical protein PYW08_010466 [Mythimna loreyi]
MVKCAKCGKLVTKKCPGIQCSKCSKWIHASCASITADQLNVLYSTDAVDWRCRSCIGSAKPKRLSCILPDVDDEDITDTENLMDTNITQRILSYIRREVRDIIKEELQSTLQFYSDKIDEYEQKINGFENKLKLVENQNMELKNKYKNLELKHDVMEQKLNAIEQQKLANNIDICGVAETEDVNSVLKNLCTKLKLQPDNVVNMYRKKNKRSETKSEKVPPVIIVTLKEGCRDSWLQVAKTHSITGKDLGCGEDNKIYLRESLSPTTAYLLWATKAALKFTNICKFVWYKNGQILVKRDKKGKTYNVRSEKDIQKLVSDFKNNQNT